MHSQPPPLSRGGSISRICLRHAGHRRAVRLSLVPRTVLERPKSQQLPAVPRGDCQRQPGCHGPVPVRRRKPQPVPPALVRPMPEAPASAPASTAARGSLWRRRQSRVRHAGFCSFFTSSTSLSVRPDLSNHFSQHVKTHSTRFHEVYATSLQFFPENQSAACSACQFNSTGQGQIVDYGFVCNMVLYSFYSPVKHDSGGIESVVTTGVVLVGSCWILCPGLPGRQPCLVTSMASPDWVVAGSCFVVAFACVPLGRVRHVSRRTRRSLLHQKSDSVGLRVY